MIDERSRLSGEAYEVAPMLLGWTISHRSDAGTVTVALTEVEAYAGESDPASHAYRGRSPRNSVMFGPAGFLYCYFTYGMHWCCNVVTGPDGKASAVLLRAGRVVEGVDLARTRRGERVSELSLARGPANLAQALGLGREQNGADLLSGGTVSLSPGSVSGQVSSGPRVGISVAHETPWRFWLTGEPSVSAYKRSPKAI
jgi:DNA-3-methyladenine glycosylase